MFVSLDDFGEKSRNYFFYDKTHPKWCQIKPKGWRSISLNCLTALRGVSHTFKLLDKMNALNNRPAQSQNEQRITSLEISKLTGKRHTDLLRSIRSQEVAWEKINERKFTLVDYKDPKGEMRPMYELTKMESLYIATKFNDEARAKLVKRWFELEFAMQENTTQKLEQSVGTYPEETVITVKMGNYSNQIYVKGGVIFGKMSAISKMLGYYATPTYFIERWGAENFMKVKVGKQEFWFMNVSAFTEMVKSNNSTPYSTIATIYQDVYGIEKQKDEENPYTFCFTDSEMLEVFMAVNQSPINKNKVLKLLSNGKQGGAKC